jgi:hypothetical protein
MRILYAAWGLLLVLFVVGLLIMRRETDKTTRRDETAADPMFRSGPARPGSARSSLASANRGAKAMPRR